MHQPLLHPLAFALIKIRATHLPIGFSLGQDLVDDDQNRMRQRNQCPFLASSGRDAPVLRRELGLLGFGRDMGNLDQNVPEPDIAFARLATQALAATLGMAGADPRPGGQMFGIGEPIQEQVQVWNPQTGQALLGDFRLINNYQALEASSNGLSWSPDGTRIVTGSRLEPLAQVWDAKTGKLLLT